MGRPAGWMMELTGRRQRLSIEIHAGASVHLLEAQPPDTLGSCLDSAWATLRDRYFADPLVHLVFDGGLPRVAEVLTDLVRRGLASRSTVPFSLERLADPRTLDLATAQAICLLEGASSYPEAICLEARRLLEASGLRPPGPGADGAAPDAAAPAT